MFFLWFVAVLTPPTPKIKLILVFRRLAQPWRRGKTHTVAAVALVWSWRGGHPPAAAAAAAVAFAPTVGGIHPPTGYPRTWQQTNYSWSNRRVPYPSPSDFPFPPKFDCLRCARQGPQRHRPVAITTCTLLPTKRGLALKIVDEATVTSH